MGLRWAVQGCGRATPTSSLLTCFKAVGIGETFLLAYILASLVGKSYLETRAGVWRLYQTSNLVLTMFMVLFVIRNVHRIYTAHLPKGVLMCVYAFTAWGLVTCVAQTKPIPTLIAYSAYASMVYVSIVFPLVFVSKISVSGFLKMLTFLVSLFSVCSLLAYFTGLPAMPDGRLRGLSNNALTCGNVALIGIILQLWWFIRYRPPLWIWLVMLGANIAVIVLTKCRSMYIGVPVVIAFATLHRASIRGLPSTLLGFCSVALVVLLVWMSGLLSETMIAEAREFSRLDQDVGEMAADRTTYWEPGLKQDLDLTNVFGSGFLAAYGWNVGESQSGYSIDLNRHNAFLSCAQSYGIPGLVTWCLLLILMLHHLWNRRDHLATLGFVTLSYSLLNGLISNHLLGFGSPPDRISWVLIGLSLAGGARKQPAGNIHTVAGEHEQRWTRR